MQLMRTLYVTDHRAKVGISKGNILVTGESGKNRVPIETLSSIVLLGAGQVTTDALSTCTRRGIRICSLTRGGKVRFTVGGETRGNVLLRVAQMRRADDLNSATSTARNIVAGKIQNSRSSVQRWSWDANEPEKSFLSNGVVALGERIGRLAGRIDGDSIRGIEGDAARLYFSCLGSHLAAHGSLLPYGTRTRRPPRDPVNALLSFVYGLIHAEVNGSLESVGLDPQIGFLHLPRPGRQSLTLDLMEEFRAPLADRFVVRLVLRRQIRLEHFRLVPGGGCYLNDVGRVELLRHYEEFRNQSVSHIVLDRDVPRWSLPTVQATLLARHIRGDLPVYPPFISVA